ncbi:hypothetical protein FAD_0252 [Ferroplasma acidiphilum]|uniref:Uncharacterized protein n=3 Tax=Ferroplasmaceae TaxID=90142 RepID=S0AQJ7_FERAC|nr:hypothetical protein FACI_IFERC00001G1241 [Ferroplasma acidarmanus Fer1]ARD84176.1 hypothetical protein FAD_0252 [Ferroplasma acidiphilum]
MNSNVLYHFLRKIRRTETFILWDVITVHMTVRPKKVTRKDGNTYYSLVDEKRVKGKVVQKYVGYLGKDLHSKNEIKLEDILPYIKRLLDKKISQEDIDSILKKIGIEYDSWPITKIMIENDLKLKKTFLRLK